MRVTLRIVGGLAVLALAIVLVSFAVNFYDEPLSADAKDLLALPADPYSSGENIYFSAAGFDAPAGQSVVETGVARIGEYNHTVEWRLTHPMDVAAYITKTDPKALTFKGEFCGSWPSSIWKEAKTHRAEISASLKTNEELYRRYLELHLPRGYYETARASVIGPYYFVPASVRCLYLANFAMRVRTGPLDEQRAAIEDLWQDLAVWKAMLEGEGTLVSKMVAVASLHRDLVVLADTIADPNSDLSLFDGERGAILTPFPLTDWDIGNVFGAEFRTISSIYAPLGRHSVSVESPIWGDHDGSGRQSSGRAAFQHCGVSSTSVELISPFRFEGRGSGAGRWGSI